MRTKIPWFGAAALLALTASYIAPASAGASNEAVYEVTITNLTDGQPLTPPVVATHRGSFELFRVGRAPTFEVKEVAENGNPGPLLALLGDTDEVADVFAAGAPLVPPDTPGDDSFDPSVTFTIDATEGARFLSWQSMLICTNDGFTGAAGMKLPNHVGETVTASTLGYDAGTEINTEDFVDIVPPCQALIGVASEDSGTDVSNPALAEGGVIHHHAGIVGGVDLVPQVHGWDVTQPVATISVTRTN